MTSVGLGQDSGEAGIDLVEDFRGRRGGRCGGHHHGLLKMINLFQGRCHFSCLGVWVCSEEVWKIGIVLINRFTGPLYLARGRQVI